MSRTPFLLIDAGNSRIKWALVDGRGVSLGAGVFAHAEAASGSAANVTAPRHAAKAPSSAGSMEAASAVEFIPSADEADEADPADEADAGDAANAPDAGAADAAAGTTSGNGPAAAAPPDWSTLPEPGSAWISNVAGETAAARIAAAIDAHWPNLPRTTIRACARQCGVTNGYGEPERLGSDRWAGMIGAHALFAGEHLLIATLGTATTLEALRADGTFTGGLIAPGWSLMMRSLGEHTAQLPTVEADSARALTGDAHAHRWFATDTRHAISAGALLAQTGLIERAWHELRRAWDAPVRLVLGGGAAEDVARALSVPHTRHEGLVLAGLAIIAAEGAAAGGSNARAPLPA
jgi:type III pantothenate kinase